MAITCRSLLFTESVVQEYDVTKSTVLKHTQNSSNLTSICIKFIILFFTFHRIWSEILATCKQTCTVRYRGQLPLCQQRCCMWNKCRRGSMRTGGREVQWTSRRPHRRSRESPWTPPETFQYIWLYWIIAPKQLRQFGGLCVLAGWKSSRSICSKSGLYSQGPDVL